MFFFHLPKKKQSEQSGVCGDGSKSRKEKQIKEKANQGNNKKKTKEQAGAELGELGQEVDRLTATDCNAAAISLNKFFDQSNFLFAFPLGGGGRGKAKES